MKKIALTLLSIFSLFVISCEIGLGASVDTDPPSLDIVNPPVDAIIRDNFTISGIWSDDGKVKNVSVKLSRTDGKGSSHSFSGKITEDSKKRGTGNWFVEIPVKEKDIIDGTYQAVVTIKDSSDRTTRQSTTFTIDNTAPLLILQRPATKISETPDAYGQTFSLNGMGADENSIDNIVIDIYEDAACTKLLKSIKKANVAPTIELDVAVFEEGVNNDYAVIYGSTVKKSEVTRYCKITAYDNAKRYPFEGQETADDDKGNASSSYYLYDDIYTGILENHTVTEVAKMLSGTWLLANSSRSAADVTDVKKILKQNEMSVSNFSLNPDNSPKFVVSGKTPLNKDGHDFDAGENDISNGSEVVIEVSPGLDGITLNMGSLRPYVLPCDIYGEPTVEDIPANRIYLASTGTGAKSGSSYKFVVALTQGLAAKNSAIALNLNAAEKTFIFKVEGSDVRGNKVGTNGKGYGFNFVSNEAAPDLGTLQTSTDGVNWSSENLVYIGKNKPLYIKGTVFVESGLAELSLFKDYTINPTAIATDNGNTSTHAMYKTAVPGAENEFEYMIPASEFNQSVSKQYSIRLEAFKDKKSVSTVTVRYDVDGPIIRNYSITPKIAAPAGNNTLGVLNGKVLVSGLLSDAYSGLDTTNASWKVLSSDSPDGPWTDVEAGAIASPEDFTDDKVIVIDTTKVIAYDANNPSAVKYMRLILTAYDAVGNKSEFPYVYTVDQSSDIPKVVAVGTTLDTGLSSYADLRAAIASSDSSDDTNIIAKGATVTFKITDDDGFFNSSTTNSGLIIKRTENQSADGSSFVPGEVVTEYCSISGNPTTPILTYDFPDKIASYKIELILKDKYAGTSQALPTSRNDSYVFYVQCKGNSPAVLQTVTPEYVTSSPVSKVINPKRGLSVKLTITDGTGPYKAFFVEANGNETEKTVTTPANSNDSPYVTDTYTILTDTSTLTPSGSGNLVYRIYDSFGQKKEVNVPYKLDNDAPETFTITAIPANTTIGSNNSSYTFQGSVSDSRSGIDKVELAFDSNFATPYTASSGSSTWTYVARFSELGLSEGENTLYARAIDNVGNVKEAEAITFEYDVSDPEASITEFIEKDGSTSHTLTTTKFEYGYKFSLKGRAYDSNSVSSVKLIQTKIGGNSNGTNQEIEITSGLSRSGDTWTFNNLPRAANATSFAAASAGDTKAATGTYQYKVVVTDAAGKTAESGLYTLVVDNTPPVLTLEAPSINIDISGENSLAGNSYTFKATSTDEDGTGTQFIYYKFDSASEYTSVAAEDNLQWKLTKPLGTGTTVTDSDVLYEGAHSVSIYAADKAGNTSTPITKTFYVDQENPEITAKVDGTELSVSTEQKKSAAYSFTFIVTESNALDSTSPVEIVFKKDTTTLSFGSGYTIKQGTNPVNALSAIEPGKEYTIIPSAALTDALYTYEITAKDAAGKTNKITRKLRLDTTPPQISVTSPDPAKWQSMNTLTVLGTADDASGTAAVYYAINPASAPVIPASQAASEESWTNAGWAAASGADSWSIPLSGLDNSDSNMLYLAAIDVNGNTSAAPTLVALKVDASAPEIKGLKYTISNGAKENISGMVYLNREASSTLTVYGSYTEDLSQVDLAHLNFAVSGESIDSAYLNSLTFYSDADCTAQLAAGTTFADTAFWKAVFKKDIPEGTFTVIGKNGAGVAKQENLFTIKEDKLAPTVNNVALSNSFVKHETASDIYFVNNTDKTFTISGNSSDTISGIKTVTLTVENTALASDYESGSKPADITTIENSGTLDAWKFTGIDMKTWKKGARATIRITDAAGNSKYEILNITFDTTGPVAGHEIDGSMKGDQLNPKDLYFRIGAQNRDEGLDEDGNAITASPTNAPAWDSDLDEDVGAKYSNGTYGNETSIEIRGRFDDEGSGVKEIFYKIFDVEPLGRPLADITADVLSAPDGSFSLREEEEKRVFYTKANGLPAGDTNTNRINTGTAAAPKYKYYKNIKTNFREKLTGFREGNNYLVLVAVDNVGNKAIDAVTIGEGSSAVTYPNFSLNIDRTAPTITSATTETMYTNAAAGKTIELSGSVTDDAAGVSKVVILHPTEKDASNQPKEIKATLNGSSWSYSLDASVLADASGTTSIYAKAYDAAGSGNWTKIETAKVVVDTTPPEITLDAPADADESEAAPGTQINGSIKLTGSASDKIGTTPNNKFTVTKLQYKMTKNAAGTSVSNNWADLTTTLMPDFRIISSESFTITGFDTTKLTDNATYRLRAVVEDSAGNTKESDEVEVVVNQDSDRPKVNLSNLTLQASGTSYLKSTKTLYLSVSDDDGVQYVKYKIDTAASWTTLNGSSIEIKGATDDANVDGEHTIYFEIKDKAGTVFTSSASPSPKITDGTTSRNDNLLVNVVTKAPEVKNIEYSVYNEESSQWSSWASSAGTVGGPRFTKIKIRLKASSAQSVNSATASYNGTVYNFTCSEVHNNAAEHTWTSEEITVGRTLNSKQTVSLAVKDAVPDPMINTTTVEINLDNTVPVLEITEPASLIGQDATIMGDVYEDVTMYYAVSRYCRLKADGTPDEASVYTDAQVTPGDSVKTDTDGTTVLATKWEELVREDTGNKWYVYFDDKYKTGSTTEFEPDHTSKLGSYLTEDYLGITTKEAISATVNPYESKTPLYFWIKAVDKCGNETIEKKKLNIDPQGERPIVEISYPADDEILGGAIRMTGTATDNNSAKYVWIQIDKDGTEGFSQDELAYLKTKGYKIGKISTNTELNAAPANLGNGANAAADYGIMVEVKGTGWSQTINSEGEFNKNGDIATLKITVYATDADATPHMSLPAKKSVGIDSRKPYVEQSSLELVQYGSSGNITSRKPYTSDARISGIWYLIGNIKDDDSGIAEIKHNANQRITASGNSFTDAVDTNYKFTAVSKIITDDGGNQKTIYNYSFSVPLGNTTAGRVGTDTASFVIKEAVDTGATSIEPAYSILFDNKAPVLTTDSSDSSITLERNVQNSNGFYTFGAKASEDKVDDVEQSGVERIAFYFTRDLEYGLKDLDSETYSSHSTGTGAETHDLFDVMIYHKNTDADDVASGNMIINYQTSSSTWKKENGLYWYAISGTVSNKTFTYTGTANKNIHKKGLAKINGSIYLIDDVAGTIVTLDGAPGDTPSGETTEALFAVCNVIDHSDKNGSAKISATGYGYGYYDARAKDDGDLFTESFSKQGTDWYFDAAVNSKNLPDGPITLHMVAFDKAGNYAEWDSSALDFVVSNNAPRIAGMQIGTDENGNGTVEASEFTSKYSDIYSLGYDDSGYEMTEVTLPVQTGTTPKAAVTVKGNTVIMPELVGGNGKIKYTYKVYKYISEQNWESSPEHTVSSPVEIATGTTDAVASLTANIELPVSDFIGKTNNSDTKQIDDGNYKKFAFSFGDSTPGKTKTAGTSNNATLNVIMNVALREANSANNWILPLYWNSTSDNSLFKQSSAEGHIELAKDWILANGYDSSKEELDADPKVSGRIKLEGIARDDTLLRDIIVKLSKKLGTTGGFAADTDLTIASYTPADTSWTTTALKNDGTIDSTKGWASAIQQASYGELVQAGLLDASKVTDNPEEVGTEVNGVLKEYLSTALVKYTSQEFGHVVHWILYLDTALVDGVVATNVAVTATATDRGKPKWSGTEASGSVVYAQNASVVTGAAAISGAVSKTGTGENVTVVTGALTGNYKMDIVPYITAVSRKASFNTNRARSGAVSLLRGETENLISGFNLANADNTTIKIFPDKAATGTETAEMGSVAVSGSGLSFTVPADAKSGYLSVVVNNVAALNNINAYKAYNTETNAKAYDHNELTDDRYVHIWRVSQQDTFKGSKNAVFPAMARGTDGTLYASFTNYGESKVYYTKSFTGNNAVQLSKYSGVKNSAADDSIQTTADNNNGVATLFWGYDPPEETAIALGPNNEVNVLYAANYQGGGTNSWDNSAVGDAGGLYVYSTNATDTQNHSTGPKRGKFYRGELYTYDDELNQFRNIRVTRSGNYIYTAYYDRLTGAIKTNIINDAATGTDARPNTSARGLPWITLDGTLDDFDNNPGGRYTIGGRTNCFGISVGGTTYGFAPFDNRNNGGSAWIPFPNVNYENGLSRSNGTGESVAITTNNSGYPVILYMDAGTGCLRIARGSSVYPKTQNDWTVQGVFASTDPNYSTASDYMSCAIDSSGYLHIAFQNTKGQLVYAKSTNNPSDGSAYTFGSSQVLDDSGMWIDMTMNGTTPYISYLSRVNSYDGMKIAFLDSNFDADNDGAADTFDYNDDGVIDATGGWETLTAAMDAKVTNVRTCIETNAKAFDTNSYTAAIGFCPGLDYRAAFYVGQ